MSALDKKIAEAIALGVDYVRTMPIPPAMAQECARRWLLDEARDAERARAREIERSSLIAAITTPEALARAEILERFGAAGFREWVLALPSETLPFFAKGVETTRVVNLWNEGASDDRPFKLWREGRFDEAFERLTLNAREHRERNNEARRKAWGRTLNDVDRVIDERAADLGIEWTAALLTETVAMPDGSRVPWGEATIAEHEARIAMLAKHAAAEIETAARHRAAVETIKAAGVTCLNDLVLVGA